MNLQSMKRRSVPLHAEVAGVLRHQILSGDLPAGAKLPALRELTEQLGVARMTVVQAMNTLEEEGLIERHLGRGTFVRKIKAAHRYTLNMQTSLEQIYSLVSHLEVSFHEIEMILQTDAKSGAQYRRIRRVHDKDGQPFCRVDIQLDNSVFERAPDRFGREIVVSVLKDIGEPIASARQNLRISYADFELAKLLNVDVNSAVFRVQREFFNHDEHLIYSATLLYPGDLLELEIEFMA